MLFFAFPHFIYIKYNESSEHGQLRTWTEKGDLFLDVGIVYGQWLRCRLQAYINIFIFSHWFVSRNTSPNFSTPTSTSCSSSSFLGRCKLNASFMDHQYSTSMLLPTAQLQLTSTKKDKMEQYLAVFHLAYMEGFNLVSNFCL